MEDVLAINRAAGAQCLAKEHDGADHEARFAALVARQSRFVFRVAYAVLRNTHDAEDAAQELFLKLYRSGTWERMRDERAFLARAAWRMAADKLPKRRGDAPDGSIASTDPNPERAALSADWTEAVHRMIDALPEDLRQPLALSGIEEMSSREIARVMDIPEGTVRTRLMRGRELLKRKLTNQGRSL